MKRLNGKGKNVLIIPDNHAPYSHKDWIPFLKAIKKKYKTALAIHLGDEVDNHSISFHDSDPNLASAGDELKKAILEMKKLEKIFPTLYIADSNHGSLIFRKFLSCGLPTQYLKSLQNIYGTPKWYWSESYILSTKLGPIYICHGKSATYGKLCKEVSMSAIQGHFHSKFEITWHNTATREIFNCFSGCLIDRDSLAFAYGKNHLPDPILGATVISKEGYPLLIKMGLTPSGRWDKKIP